MKHRFGDLSRKCQFPLLLAFGFMPISSIALIHAAPQAAVSPFLFPMAYALLACICLVVPGRIRVPAGLLGCAALFALGWAALPIRRHPLSLLVPLAYGVLLLAGLRMAALPRNQEISFFCCPSGLLVHALAQIMINLTRRSGSTLYDAIQSALVAAFIAFLLFSMLSLNRASMENATLGRQGVPMSMRRANTVLTLCFLALVVFISALPAAARAIRGAWNGLVSAAKALAAWLAGLFPASEEILAGAAQVPASDLSGLGEMGKPSAFALMMEKIVSVLALIAAVVIGAVALHLLLQKLAVLLRFLWKQLSRYMAASSENYYEDEITDTRDNDLERQSGLMQRLKRRFAPVDEKRLSPGERIRYRYLRLMMRHPDWHESRTARENLEADAAALYERARYSDHPITQEEADRFAADVKNR